MSLLLSRNSLPRIAFELEEIANAPKVRTALERSRELRSAALYFIGVYTSLDVAMEWYGQQIDGAYAAGVSIEDDDARIAKYIFQLVCLHKVYRTLYIYLRASFSVLHAMTSFLDQSYRISAYRCAQVFGINSIDWVICRQLCDNIFGPYNIDSAFGNAGTALGKVWPRTFTQEHFNDVVAFVEHLDAIEMVGFTEDQFPVDAYPDMDNALPGPPESSVAYPMFLLYTQGLGDMIEGFGELVRVAATEWHSV
jgi:hypothetical protein